MEGDEPQFQQPSFPTIIDNTMRKAFTRCPQAFFRAYVERLKPKGKSEHLVAGGAYAKGLEVARTRIYRHGDSIADALVPAIRAAALEYGDFDPPDNSPKHFPNVVHALLQYFRDFPPDTDRIKPWMFSDGVLGHQASQIPAVEFSFCEPLPISHPETGDPVLYGGKFDMLGDMNGLPFVVDDKTTSYISEKWVRQWQLESQFIGYTWGAQQSSYNIQGTLVRGMSFQKTMNRSLEVHLHHPQFIIDRWYEQLLKDVERMIQCWHAGYFDYNFGDACSDFGGCAFLDLCTTNDPESWKPIHFEHNPWTPISDEVF